MPHPLVFLVAAFGNLVGRFGESFFAVAGRRLARTQPCSRWSPPPSPPRSSRAPSPPCLCPVTPPPWDASISECRSPRPSIRLPLVFPLRSCLLAAAAWPRRCSLVGRSYCTHRLRARCILSDRHPLYEPRARQSALLRCLRGACICCFARRQASGGGATCADRPAAAAARCGRLGGNCSRPRCGSRFACPLPTRRRVLSFGKERGIELCCIAMAPRLSWTAETEPLVNWAVRAPEAGAVSVLARSHRGVGVVWLGCSCFALALGLGGAIRRPGRSAGVRPRVWARTEF